MSRRASTRSASATTPAQIALFAGVPSARSATSETRLRRLVGDLETRALNRENGSDERIRARVRDDFASLRSLIWTL